MQVSPPVFYVEKPLKKYEPNNDKRSRSKQTTTKNSTATSCVGQERPSNDDPSQKGAPSTENKGNIKKRGRKSSEAHAKTDENSCPEKEQGHEGDPKKGKTGSDQKDDGQKTSEQGCSGDDQGKGDGQEHEKGEGCQAPVLTEREQKLQAARERAKELRKAKTEEKRATKDAERASEKPVKQTKKSEPRPLDPMLQDKEIPAPLPPKELPSFNPIGGEKSTIKDTAFPYTNPIELPVVRKSKKPRTVSFEDDTRGPTSVQSREVPDEEEDKELKRLRKDLEKKRLMKESMDLDREMNKSVKPVIHSDRDNHGIRNPMDDLYKQQMNQIKRTMLMEAIFGSSK